jgi:hypothetical protein
VAFRRLQHYTRHVRSITCCPFWIVDPEGSEKTQIFHYSALHAICHHPALPDVLFPKLKDVRLPVLNDHPLENIFILALTFTPSMQNVTIITDESMSFSDIDGRSTPRDITGPVWAALVTRVTDIAPQLISLKVELSKKAQVDAHWAGPIPSILNALTSFSHLNLLNIAPLMLSASSLTALGTLPNLKSLTMSLFGFQEELMDSLEAIHIDSLVHLSVDTDSLDVCAMFLGLLHAKELKSLTLGCLMETSTSLAPFFHDLGQRERYAVLEEITLRQVFGGAEYDPTWISVTDEPVFIFYTVAVQPLLVFKNLTALSICNCAALELENSHLKEIFSSLPRLKSFELKEVYLADDADDSAITLGGVHSALRFVPELERLTLSFDGSTLPPPPHSTEPPARQQPHPALRYWNVCASPVTHPTPLSEWLISNYPALIEIEYFGTYLWGMKEMYTVAEDGRVSAHDRGYLDAFEEVAVMVDRWNSVKRAIRARRGSQ